ncbi:MAG TPA: sigma-54 dependent transcriptional regulator [Pyrinomonadaceae bacterium]|nr:sigma-54 dependent transcriptional regulator [Pyrinomonadaceae bacterium]
MKLLIVDDEAGYREVLQAIFAAEGYEVDAANNGRAALAHLKKGGVDLIVSDVRMPDMDGIELLRSAKEIDADTSVVLMTAFGTIATAREAFKLGADDFIQKPFNNEELKLIVKRTLETRAIISENRAFKTAQRRQGSIENIIGRSEKILELKRMISAVANEEATILITGESGTGKELVARAVHDMSGRAEKPFIPINCGAIPETLLESELFGFMKGTFTGASANRAGMFESANKGSIFLDEIGDMPLSMQVKMLRVLQERMVRRVGASNEVPVDTRVIAATNRDIRPMVDDGRFRQDLYFRISVIPLNIPPLRERREDIPDLAEHFINKFCARSGKKLSLSDEAANALLNRKWPGNVRELEHTIERAVALSNGDGVISAGHCAENTADLQTRTIELPADGIELKTYMDKIEKEFVAEALHRTRGNQTKAAELLKMKDHQLRHLLEKHDLK